MEKWIMPKLAKYRENPNIRVEQELLVLAFLVVILGAISLFLGKLLTLANILNLMRSFMEIAIIALAATFVILTGGIDISVGSVMSLCAVILGVVYQQTSNIGLAALCVLGVGMVCGLINGYFIGYLGMPAMVVTLCGMYMYKGVALGISEAQTYSGFPDKFMFLGQGYIARIPTQVVVFILLAIVVSILLTKTAYGRKVRAVGFNPLSSQFSGIDSRKIKMATYFVCSLMCALATLIYVARVSIAKADAGSGYEMDVLTAVVLGGTSTAGGRGSIRGTVLGAVTVGLLRSGMTMIRVTSDVTTIIIGLLLIVSIIISIRLDKRKKSHQKSK